MEPPSLDTICSGKPGHDRHSVDGADHVNSAVAFCDLRSSAYQYSLHDVDKEICNRPLERPRKGGGGGGGGVVCHMVCGCKWLPAKQNLQIRLRLHE